MEKPTPRWDARWNAKRAAPVDRGRECSRSAVAISP
jgi:hypothetical protein